MKSSGKGTGASAGKGGLRGPSNLGNVKAGRSGAKMTKPHRIKSRAPKGGGRY